MDHYNNAGTVDANGDLAYDLRQIYAKLVGEHLQDISLARKSDKYHLYYKSLRDLYIIVKHKFKDKEVKDLEGNKTTETKLFNDLIKVVVEIANKYPQEWVGKSQAPDACSKIELALNDIEMSLYEKIDDAKMFGGGGKTPGL